MPFISATNPQLTSEEIKQAASEKGFTDEPVPSGVYLMEVVDEPKAFFHDGVPYISFLLKHVSEDWKKHQGVNLTFFRSKEDRNVDSTVSISNIVKFALAADYKLEEITNPCTMIDESETIPFGKGTAAKAALSINGTEPFAVKETQVQVRLGRGKRKDGTPENKVMEIIDPLATQAETSATTEGNGVSL